MGNTEKFDLKKVTKEEDCLIAPYNFLVFYDRVSGVRAR